MMVPGWIGHLPAVNASLNALSGILLLIGYAFMKKGRIRAHRRTMIAATVTSGIFLVSYLIYHYQARMTPFAGTGGWRTLYFSILISHVILAIAIVPLALMTLRRGLRGAIPAHKRIARVTFPLWVYVSATGVLVYFFLYQWFPARG